MSLIQTIKRPIEPNVRRLLAIEWFGFSHGIRFHYPVKVSTFASGTKQARCETCGKSTPII